MREVDSVVGREGGIQCTGTSDFRNEEVCGAWCRLGIQRLTCCGPSFMAKLQVSAHEAMPVFTREGGRISGEQEESTEKQAIE